MMEDIYSSGSTKTAAQIIAEAKASVYPSMSQSNSLHMGLAGLAGDHRPIRKPEVTTASASATRMKRSRSTPLASSQRVLTTERPFTPRHSERNLYPMSQRRNSSRPPSSMVHFGIIKEEDVDSLDSISSTVSPSASCMKLAPLKHLRTSNTKRDSLLTRSMSASGKLPSIVKPTTARQQFRRLSSGHASLQSERPGLVSSESLLSMSTKEEQRPIAIMARPKTASEVSASTVAVLSRSSSISSQGSLEKSTTSGTEDNSSGSTPSSSASGAHRDRGHKEDRFQKLIANLEASQDDGNTSHCLELMYYYLSMNNDSKVDSGQRKQLMPILSRHLVSDNVRVLFPLLDIVLILMRGHVSKTLMVLAAKMVFKLAKDDTNDTLFLVRPTLDLFLTALGYHCPVADHEAYVYAYGGLKFLTLNPKITNHLESVGFLHLSVLHIKLLCDQTTTQTSTPNPKTAAAMAQVMFQVSSCTRNMINSKASRLKFIEDLHGTDLMLATIQTFKDDVDVMCNVCRILSILTATHVDQVIAEQDHGGRMAAATAASELVSALFRVLKQHRTRRDIVVRATFVLGNLAAKSESHREAIGRNADTFDLLPDLLNGYVDSMINDLDGQEQDPGEEANVDFGSTGSVEDTAIKVIRVFANTSINPEAGEKLASTVSLVEGLLKVAARVPLDKYTLILQPTLATLNNLSFYPIVNQVETYEALKSYLLHDDTLVATETARVLGNLSRRPEVRRIIKEDGFFKTTLGLLLATDRDLVYAIVGVVINMMSDGGLRPTFKSEAGVKKCISVLHCCLENEDWPLACLVCQAIWNFCIDSNSLSEVIEETYLVELEDIIVYLLEACNERMQINHERNGNDSSSSASDEAATDLASSEFCHVALSLLKRILDESPRKVELLLDDD